MAAPAIRPARITRVLPDSIAEEIGFEPGDALVAINGQKPRDLIDYRFLCADEDLALEVLDSRGKTHRINLKKILTTTWVWSLSRPCSMVSCSATTPAPSALLTSSPPASGAPFISKTTITG
jgi:NifB/MoaA-like Fe-S oxidoreductase